MSGVGGAVAAAGHAAVLHSDSLDKTAALEREIANGCEFALPPPFHFWYEHVGLFF